ncbi:MAG: ATP-dependent DNA helicase, partial [Clostridia bacterium]|nr:ATP-dependent DNA helicase [Clostridia bacterium]
LAFIVLGGVFAEGIDLPGERLSGAAIVTTGMPQLGFERDQLAMLMDDGFGSGYASAYVYPGIRRVLQAAGRVIRTETDKGVVLLIDKRYDAEDIRDLLPTYWNVRRISKMEKLEGALDKFWKGFS